MRQVKKEEWSGYIKGISIQIVKWQDVRSEKPIWNSYMIINKDTLGDRFKEIVCKAKKYGKRYSFDYWKLGQFDMHCGLSFYEKIFNEVGKVVAIKVGCDYNHLWDEDCPAYYEYVLQELTQSVEYFINYYPDYKVWCSGNGNYYKPSQGTFGDDGYFRSNEYNLSK